MRLYQRMDWLECRRAGSDLFRKRRQAEINALAQIALALPVQRLMLRKLFKEDHRQEVRTGKAARRHMEPSRWLGDLLALPARELLPNGLDHLPLARDHLQRFGDILTELGPPGFFGMRQSMPSRR